jgi:hypothetical protein
MPMLLQRLIETVRVFYALDVNTSAGVAVVIPGAADARSGINNKRPQAHEAGLDKHVHAGEAGANDQNI